MGRQLTFNLLRDGSRELFFRCEQDGCCKWVVFCLSQEVGRHLLWFGGLVGDYQDFTWACQRIDSHLAIDRFFGQGHEKISWSTDDINLLDGFCSIGKSRDCLCTAYSIHLPDPSDVSGCKNSGVDQSVGSSRSDHRDSLHACSFCRYGIHQNCAGVCSSAPWDVEASCMNWAPAPTDLLPVNPGNA